MNWWINEKDWSKEMLGSFAWIMPVSGEKNILKKQILASGKCHIFRIAASKSLFYVFDVYFFCLCVCWWVSPLGYSVKQSDRNIPTVHLWFFYCTSSGNVYVRSFERNCLHCGTNLLCCQQVSSYSYILL